MISKQSIFKISSVFILSFSPALFADETAVVTPITVNESPSEMLPPAETEPEDNYVPLMGISFLGDPFGSSLQFGSHFGSNDRCSAPVHKQFCCPFYIESTAGLAGASTAVGLGITTPWLGFAGSRLAVMYRGSFSWTSTITPNSLPQGFHPSIEAMVTLNVIRFTFSRFYRTKSDQVNFLALGFVL